MIEALLQAERLLLHGLVDEAEKLYRRTLESDPRNSIAVVGLARVALERGDDRLAYAHACEALTIDRQNAAALRLEARLSEVMATRGEPVERPAWVVVESPSGTRPAKAGDAPAAAPVVQPPGRESERAALARNPSMADHRRRDEQPARAGSPAEAGEPADAPEPDGPQAPPPAAGPRRRRPKGALRRLFGLRGE